MKSTPSSSPSKSKSKKRFRKKDKSKSKQVDTPQKESTYKKKSKDDQYHLFRSKLSQVSLKPLIPILKPKAEGQEF